MLGEVKGRSGCLDATVKNANTSGMADKLLKLGLASLMFTTSGPSVGRIRRSRSACDRDVG